MTPGAGRHRRGDRRETSNKTAAGEEKADKIRWRVEYTNEDGVFCSEPFNYRILVDELTESLRKRGLKYRVINL